MTSNPNLLKWLSPPESIRFRKIARPDSLRGISERRSRQDPFFSVIMPTFNRSYCISTAIQSVQLQDFRSWELIIVDDGSSDDTTAVVRKFCESDDRIRLLTQENQGPAVARNLGMTIAKGKYLAFIDSDDAYKENHLAIRHQMFQEEPSLDFLFGGMKVLGNPLVPDRDDPTQFINIENIGMPTGTLVVRKSVAQIVGGFPNVKYSEDSLFLEKAIQWGAKAKRVRTQTYLYNRDSVDSICAIVARTKTLP